MEEKLAESIHIPKLGMSMKEATLVEWKFNEGDQIEKGDVVLVIETEKTKWEVEAPASGLLHIAVEINVTEKVGAVVGMIAGSKEELETIQKDSGAPAVAVAEPAAASASAPTKASAEKAGKGERIRITPVARRLAEENMIDLTSVTGSGPGGRIIKEDIERAIEAKKAAPEAAPAETAEAEEYDGKKIKGRIPLRGMRKAIASHMHASLATAAQLTSMGELEMTELKKLREDLLKQEEALGTRVTYTDIYVLAIAKTLKQLPMVNASLIEDEVILWDDINVGVAVALEGADDLGGGLIVPVVKNADRKSLAEISKELKGIISKAREGKLMPDDVSGGTFTLTNLGGPGGGWGFGTPIINQPQSAILGTGSIVDRPVVKDGKIVIRPMMPYSFTFDHRVIDGVPAGMFMNRLAQLLSNPLLLLS